MKTDASDQTSEPLASDRASERTVRRNRGVDRPYGQIPRLEKTLRDLVTGMRNLRALRPAPWDLETRVLAQAAKIRSVEEKLLALRQERLL